MTNFSPPLVSVVLPTHNGELFIEQAIQSVLDQKYPKLEIIVVDDKSDDRSLEIAELILGLICVPSTGQGVGGAWNTGIRIAKGKYIAFQADDDIWLPGKLYTQVQYMEEHAEISYCVTKSRFFVNDGHIPDKGFRPEHLGHDTQLILMEATLIRSAAFTDIGYFDDTLSSAQELDWIARANDAGLEMGRIDKMLLYKRVHSSNMTYDSNKIDSNNKNLLKLLRESIKRKHTGQTTD